MEERSVTKQEEQAYRLVHHDFDGKTVKEASKIMGVSIDKVYRLLRSMKKKAPQLFPILTPREAIVAKMLLEEELTEQQIADMSKCSVNSIYLLITRMRNKGFCIPKIKAPVRYTESMDGKIKRKF